MNPAIANAGEFVAVDEHVPRAGAIVWWRLSGDVYEEELRAEWTARGLNEKLLPSPPGKSTALSRAMMDQATAHGADRILARPMAERGSKALVVEHVEASTPGGQDDLTYRVALRATVNGQDPKFEPSDHASIPEILRCYHRHLSALTADDVGGWLVKLVAYCDGVRLRDTGGVYFVPESRREEWRSIATAIHATSGHRINGIPALRAEDAVASILDAISEEAKRIAEDMQVELAEGTVTPRKARKRIERWENAEAKITRYEELLGVKAEGLREKLEGVRAGLAAVLLDGAEDALEV